MPIDTVAKVWKRDGNKPGSVVFSGGAKLTTFSDALVSLAERNIGQLVEYTTTTTEKNGKTYTNLGEIKPYGGPAPSTPASTAAVSAETDKLLARGVAVLERVAGLLEKIANPVLVVKNDGNDFAISEKQLGDKIGADAARAMFDALKAKHEDPAKFQAAVADLLKVHGIGS